MIVGVTATRRGLTVAQVESAAAVLVRLRKGKKELHHGGCVGGDVQLATIARVYGFRTVRHPGDSPEWQDTTWQDDEVHEPMANLIRNKVIVTTVEVMVCCPDGRLPRLRGSGTWATIRECERQDRDRWLIYPDGLVHSSY